MRHIANMEQEVKGEERAITRNSIPHDRLVSVTCTRLAETQRLQRFWPLHHLIELQACNF